MESDCRLVMETLRHNVGYKGSFMTAHFDTGVLKDSYLEREVRLEGYIFSFFKGFFPEEIY